MNSLLVNGLAVVGGYAIADFAISRMMLGKMVMQSSSPEKREEVKEVEGKYGIAEKEVNGVMTRSITVDSVTYWRAVSGGSVFNDSGRLVGATWAPSLRPSNAPGGDLIVFLDGRIGAVGGRTLGVLVVLPGMDPTFTPAVAADRSAVKTQPGTVALSGATAAGGVARSDSLYGSDLS